VLSDCVCVVTAIVVTVFILYSCCNCYLWLFVLSGRGRVVTSIVVVTVLDYTYVVT